MKRLLLASTPLLLLLASCGGVDSQTDTRAKEMVVDTLPMIVTRVKECARLYTAEYKVHKIVTHDDQLSLKGSFLQKKFNITLPMSTRKVAIPMDATLKAYIDFSEFSEKNVRTMGDKIEITLPDPKVILTESRIDHAEIKRYVSALRSNFSDAELADYERSGRASILNSVPQMGILDMAMTNATHALIPMLRSLGYEEGNIDITFRKKFTLSDLPTLLDFNFSTNDETLEEATR